MIFRKDFFITDGKVIEDSYDFCEEKPLGIGSFGKVILGTQKDTKIQRAIKIIAKEDIDDP